MAGINNPKARIAGGVGVATVSLVWIGLQSLEPFQALFQDSPIQGFFGTLFASVILACVAGGAVYALLVAIEEALG